MRRLLILSVFIAFLVWRSRKLEEQDRTNGFGPYADVRPVADT